MFKSSVLELKQPEGAVLFDLSAFQQAPRLFLKEYQLGSLEYTHGLDHLVFVKIRRPLRLI